MDYHYSIRATLKRPLIAGAQPSSPPSFYFLLKIWLFFVEHLACLSRREEDQPRSGDILTGLFTVVPLRTGG